MKIGIDSYFLRWPYSGIGQVTKNFLRSLDTPTNAGHEFFLYIDKETPETFPGNFHQRLLPPRYKFDVRPKKWALSRKWWEMVQVPAAVRRDKCDALISLYQAATVMPARFPHITLVHDIIFALLPGFRDQFYKHVILWLTLRGMRRAGHCVAVSHHTKADMIRHMGMSDEKITVAYIAADPRFAASLTEEDVSPVLRKYGLSPGYICHGGGLHERKNGRTVMEAYAILAAKSKAGVLPCPLPPLVVYGQFSVDAYTTDFDRLARELGIQEHIRPVGWFPQEELPALYKAASMFVYPSSYEGFGLPVLEAMHQGTPVITTPLTSLPEVGGDAVLYSDPKKPEELAEAMLRLLVNRELREDLSHRGMERAKRFSWESFTETLMGITLRRIEQSRGARR